MDVIFALLVLFGIIALVLGLIKPSLVVRWKDTPTRSNVIKVYGGLVVISFMAFSYVVPKVELTPEQREKIAIKKKEQIKQDLEKKHLRKIAEEKKQIELEQKNKIAKEKEYQEKLIAEKKEKEAILAKEKLIKIAQKRMSSEDVTISTKIDNQKGIITIHGTTNLPSNTKLLIYLSNDLYSASDEVEVKAGKFVSSSFTDNGKALFNEKYEISIRTKSFNEQVKEVQQIIGKNGKNLKGKFITKDFLEKENEVSYQTFIKITNSTDRKEIVSITSKNIKKVIKSLKKNYNIKATAFDNEKLNKFKMCWNDRACEIYADKVQIQGTYKTVEALTSSRVSPRYYQKICSAIMIALTDAHKDLIEPQIPQYFNYASQNGRSRWEALGVEVTINVDSSGLLGCSFYKQSEY